MLYSHSNTQKYDHLPVAYQQKSVTADLVGILYTKQLLATVLSQLPTYSSTVIEKCMVQQCVMVNCSMYL